MNEFSPEIAEAQPLAPAARSLAEVGINLATEAARTFYHDIVAPELALAPKQQEAATIRTGYSQKDLMDIAFAQLELDILDSQSPSRMFGRLFDLDPQISEDATHLEQVRKNIWELNHPPYIPGKSITMDSGDYVRAQGTSALSTPQTEILAPAPAT